MDSLIAGIGAAGVVISIGMYGWPATFAAISATLLMTGLVYRLGKVNMEKLQRQLKEEGNAYLRSKGVEIEE